MWVRSQRETTMHRLQTAPQAPFSVWGWAEEPGVKEGSKTWKRVEERCCLSACISHHLNFCQPMTTTGKQLPAFISTHEHAHAIFSPFPAAEGIECLSKHLASSQG